MTNTSKVGSLPSDIPMLPTPVPVPISTGTTIYGGMRIGIQIDTSVMSLDARIQLQRQFLERLGQLTGIDTDQERHLLARYLMFYLTLPPASSHSSQVVPPEQNENRMPSKPWEMESKLNSQYMAQICTKCMEISKQQKIELQKYKTQLISNGQDFYCVGSTGQIFCYHSLSFVEKDTGNPLAPLTNGNYKAEITVVCIGQVVGL